MIADALLLLEPRIGAQPQHVVVGKARAAESPSKIDFLLGCRVEPESVGALHFHASHGISFPCNNQPTNRRRAFLLGLKAEVSSAKKR